MENADIADIATWWRVSQAARYLDISITAVRVAIAYERIRGVKTAAGMLVEPGSVREYDRTRRLSRHKGKVTRELVDA